MNFTLDPAHAATETVAQRLVELCSTGQNRKAMEELYADDCRHVEVMECPGAPFGRVISGKKNLLAMADHFEKTTTIHAATCGKAIVNGDQFVCPMSLDCTSTEGPMANQRMQVSETTLYTVKNGKITEAKFFYGMG